MPHGEASTAAMNRDPKARSRSRMTRTRGAPAVPEKNAFSQSRLYRT